MHKRNTTKPEAEQVAGKGETHWSQASSEGLQRPAPQQPNELDESASSQEAASASMEKVGRLAYHDAVTSLDTDRGPLMDAVYNGAVIEGHRTGDAGRMRPAGDRSKSQND